MCCRCCICKKACHDHAADEGLADADAEDDDDDVAAAGCELVLAEPFLLTTEHSG